MKRITIFIILLAAGIVSVQADIVVQNDEESGLYFTLLPLADDAAKAYLSDPATGLAYLKKNVDSLEYIPPYGAVREERAESPSLLLGFFVSPEDEKLPVVSLKIPRIEKLAAFGVSKQNVAYSKEKKPYGFDAWEISYRRLSIHLDNRYLDWLKVPDLAKFSASYNPGVFSRESGGKQETKKISESLFWKKGGTQIETLKAMIEDRYLFLMISSLSEMAEGLSYFLYLFDDRSKPDTRRLTVEIPLRKRAGPVFLWMPGKSNPVFIGSYVRGAFLLEAQIDSDLLPEEILNAEWSTPSADLTSCYFEGGHSEEFYFTTFSAKDLPVKN